MKTALKLYLTEIDKTLKENKIENIEKIKSHHLNQIAIFQHERLIHLIVTSFVGIITILFLLFGLILSNILLFILFTLSMILFIHYIFYYYYLENNVQKLYYQYWCLEKK